MTPTIRLPAGPVTPHGAYHILTNRIPRVTLISPNENIVLELMGGLAIPDRQMPERVEIKSLKGLFAPWQTIDQKGATEDGVTFIDALYDPTEVDMEVVCHGRDPAKCRWVVNVLHEALDAKQQSELAWFTHEMGRWWAPIRWFKPPANDERGGATKRQARALRLRADSAFWQSYPSVDGFQFQYDGFNDAFTTNHTSDMGSGYTISYTGTGTGNIYVDSGRLRSTLATGRAGTWRVNSYTTTGDNQVISVQLGGFDGWSFPDPATNIIGGRLSSSGSPDQNGVFLTFGIGFAKLSYVKAGVETVMRQQPILVPPLPGEVWTLICGTPDDPRLFKVRRDFGRGLSVDIMAYKEVAPVATPTAISQLGSTFRSVGGGMHGAAAPVKRFNVGANTPVTQNGFLERINAGDQDMWDRYTVSGPFDKIKIWNGPGAGANEYVEFGPLKQGQVAQIRSDPRKYGVKDLSSVTNADLAKDPSGLQGMLGGLLGLVTLNPVTHLLDVFQSVFGLLGGGSAPVPPQGNLYSLLKGRFSRPIPPKPSGAPAQKYYIKVEMVNGTADSKIVATGTPLRRFPY